MREKQTENEIQFALETLDNETEMTEAEYWSNIGCSKSYGESTPWFIPSIYYEHHKEQVEEDTERFLLDCLFTKDGTIIA